MGTEFAARRAEPGQEFAYTASVDHQIVPEGEDVPEGVETVTGADIGRDGAYAERTYIRRTGVQRTLKADAHGIVHPETDEDVKVLDAFGLPEAHSGKGVDQPSSAPNKLSETKGADDGKEDK